MLTRALADCGLVPGPIFVAFWIYWGLCAFFALESPSEQLSGHPGSSSAARSSQMLAGIPCFLPGPCCSGVGLGCAPGDKIPYSDSIHMPRCCSIDFLSLAKVMERTSLSERRNRSINSTHSTHFLPTTSNISVGVEGRLLLIWRGPRTRGWPPLSYLL